MLLCIGNEVSPVVITSALRPLPFRYSLHINGPSDKRDLYVVCTCGWLRPLPRTFASHTAVLTAEADSDTEMVQIAATFHLGADLDGGRPPDVVLHSTDRIYFYVHSYVALRASRNAFGGLLSSFDNRAYASPTPGSLENSLSLALAGSDPYSGAQADTGRSSNDLDLFMSSIVDDSQMLTSVPNEDVHDDRHGANARDFPAYAGFFDPYTSITNDSPSTSALGALPIVDVPEPAAVINLLLHVAYALPISQQLMGWSELAVVVPVMLERYEYSLTRSSPLFPVLMTHAAVRPLDVFALATADDAEDLAVASSQYLLSIAPEGAQDLVARIRTPYMMRLIALLYGRVEALRQIVALALPLHGPSPAYADCSDAVQARLKADWNIVVAQLIADARYVWQENIDISPLTLSVAGLIPRGPWSSRHSQAFSRARRVNSAPPTCLTTYRLS